jgi:hypothetical protein
MADMLTSTRELELEDFRCVLGPGRYARASAGRRPFAHSGSVPLSRKRWRAEVGGKHRVPAPPAPSENGRPVLHPPQAPARSFTEHGVELPAVAHRSTPVGTPVEMYSEVCVSLSLRSCACRPAYAPLLSIYP